MLINSVILSVVLTVLLNVIPRFFPRSTQKLEQKVHKKLEDAFRDVEEGKRSRVKVFFPWKSMLLISLVLTVLVNLFNWFGSR